MTQPYLKLRNRVDNHATAVFERHGDQLACRPGCGRCCRAGLTLVLVEAVVLGAELGLDAEAVHRLADLEPLSETGGCRLLDSRDRCVAYAGRPIICRTEGLPLTYPAPTGAVICPENFRDTDPDEAAFLKMTNLETALLAANLDYCIRAELDPLARVAIDRLAQACDRNFSTPFDE